MTEACFFDLDKTVIDEEGKLYDGLNRTLDPAERSFGMTLLTARGYTRFREALADNPSLAPTPGVPVALENGARIINSDSTKTLYYHPLSPGERDSVCDYISSSDPLRYVAFHARELRTKTLLWSPDAGEAARLRNAYSHNADVFTGTKDDLFNAIRTHDPCMVTCRTRDDGSPEDLPATLAWYRRGGTVNFVPHGADKGTAAQIIADISGFELSTVLAAGNDSNDMPMLRLEELGCPVVVGTDMAGEEFADLVPRAWHISNPNHLGSLILQQVSKP